MQTQTTRLISHSWGITFPTEQAQRWRKFSQELFQASYFSKDKNTTVTVQASTQLQQSQCCLEKAGVGGVKSGGEDKAADMADTLVRDITSVPLLPPEPSFHALFQDFSTSAWQQFRCTPGFWLLQASCSPHTLPPDCDNSITSRTLPGDRALLYHTSPPFLFAIWALQGSAAFLCCIANSWVSGCSSIQGMMSNTHPFSLICMCVCV